MKKLLEVESSVVVFALRYSLDRNTSARDIVFDSIRKNIGNFEAWEIKTMIEELGHALITVRKSESAEIVGKFKSIIQFLEKG